MTSAKAPFKCARLVVSSAPYAAAKKDISKYSRVKPGVATSALPNRLGSSGTVNMPHIIAAIIGVRIASVYPKRPSAKLKPQIAIAAKAAIISRKRNPKMYWLEPIMRSDWHIIADNEELVYIDLLRFF